MRIRNLVMKIFLATLLLTPLLAAFLFAPAAAAGEVRVKISIAPCVRVRSDGTLQSNVPAVTQEDGRLLFTVTAR